MGKLPFVEMGELPFVEMGELPFAPTLLMSCF